MTKKTGTMTRKEFLRSSTAAVAAGIGLPGGIRVFGGFESAPSQPELHPLGRTGLSVTPLCFGASRTMEEELLQAALDSGINFLDTGRSYFRGRNEAMVGKVIAGRRNSVIIQSKLGMGIAGLKKTIASADAVRVMKQKMADSLDTSLKALGTDHIDILLIHGAESAGATHHEAVLDFFAGARKSGKIRAHGFSAHSNQIELIKSAVEQNFFDVIMVPYNHSGSFTHSRTGRFSEWDQPALESELDRAKKRGLGLVAMKTCSGGTYAFRSETPTYTAALKWILDGDRFHSLAVAMANFSQLEEDLKALD